jgi:hypothetical protein
VTTASVLAKVHPRWGEDGHRLVSMIWRRSQSMIIDGLGQKAESDIPVKGPMSVLGGMGKKTFVPAKISANSIFPKILTSAFELWPWIFFWDFF